MLVARGIFEESDAVIERWGPLVFGNRYAQAWYRANKATLNPGFVARANSTLENYPLDATRKAYSEIMDDL
jgi:hypothetical protein